MKAIRKILSLLLSLVLVITLIPRVTVPVEAAETSNVIILGNLGTVKIGNKTESGTWVKTQIGDEPVFCMDLGKSCRTGYVYSSKSSTISSDSSNTSTALKARIGYWFAETKDKSNKAWVYAQCLIWAVEEGITDRAGLTEIIRQVKNNTGYYSDETLYSQIFGGIDTVTCDIIVHTYAGTGDSNYIQRLMQIKAEGKKIEYYSTHVTQNFSQQIEIHKQDENGNPVPHTRFKVTAQNYKELHSLKGTGFNTITAKEGANELIIETDANGVATFDFNYQLQSDEIYYFFKGNAIPQLTAAELREYIQILDDEGLKHYGDEIGVEGLTETGAKTYAQLLLNERIAKLKNRYIIEEVSSGSDDIVTKPNYTVNGADTHMTNITGNRVTVTLEGLEPEYLQFVQDDFKKVKVTVEKKDADTQLSAGQGDATLDGAVYALYEDEQCRKIATVYNAAGNETEGIYTVVNGRFETDYLQTGKDYYLKELDPSRGYLLDETVHKIHLDGTNYTNEFNLEVEPVATSWENVEKGKVSITKTTSNSIDNSVLPEPGAEFQVYLKSAGSYDNAATTERDIIVTDEKGYGITKELPYGTYTVHQIKGDKRAELVEDFDVEVTTNGETYPYLLDDPFVTTYLKITKKDKNTGKTVLKAGTTYQIFAVDEAGKETLVTQKLNNGHEEVTVDNFVADETGQVITYEELVIGTYRIKETASASGLYNAGQSIDIEIAKDSYHTETDKDGNVIKVADVEYFNEETKAQLSIAKKGEVLTGVLTDENNNKEFIYSDTYLQGVIFEIYAKEDIVTQDNQGTTWFAAGDKVATITTGTGAEFTDTCGGICTYDVDEDGIVKVTLPLGEYTIKEVQTNYGYIIPTNASWDVKFTWSNQYEEYVLDTSGNTEEGLLSVTNDRATADVSIVKKDATTEAGVRDTVFGLYTKNDIYAADGKLLVQTGELLTTVTTGEDGTVKADIDLPLMSQNYNPESDDNTGLNSGDYFFIEKNVSDSYFIDKAPIYVHLEYKNSETPVIKSESEQKNVQTTTEISKVTLADGNELQDCDLVITDNENNEIISWTSGVSDSVVITNKAEDLGYRNITASINESGNLIINGLLHDVQYTLTETRPADGYVTAESIIFKLMPGTDEEDNNITLLFVKSDTGEFIPESENKVVMKDDTTKVEFSKTDITGGEELPGCELEVLKKSDNTIIDSWTSTDETHIIEGKLVVDEVYILRETRPCDGFTTASDIEFTVLDKGKIQKVQMTDETTKIRFSKLASDTKKLLAGAQYKVYDSNGNEVYSFVTNEDEAIFLEGVLNINETYTFVEVAAPINYEIAKDVTLTVKDTGEIQDIEVIDMRITETETPVTGVKRYTVSYLILFMLSFFGIGVITIQRKRERDE